MNDDVKTHIESTETWLRLLFMVLFAVISWITKLVLIAVVIFQFLVKLLTGDVNERALDLGGQLSSYIYQILNYLTFNTEERPFPFTDWPSGASSAEPIEHAGAEPQTQELGPEKTEPDITPADESGQDQNGA